MIKKYSIGRFLKSLNHWKLLLSGLFVVLLFLIISVYFDLFNEKYVNKTIQLFPAIIALIALAISISLYDKFGMKKYIYEKKIKVALELLEFIKTELTIYVTLCTDKGFRELNVVSISRDALKRKDLSLLLDNTLVFSYKEFKHVQDKIDDLQYSVYLERNISDKLYFITTFRNIEKFRSFKMNNSNFTIAEFKCNIEDNSFIIHSTNNITLRQYIESYLDVIQEIESWLESQTKIKGLLNFN
ncbi:hypothetical protein [Flavobacterium sp. MK4S-17]|uniref:hypothetical protein n=1 Tax=Flavobacterium sp. MK4S-17 TaxID=2543737 RepID=UPI001356C6F4|nr:hypothetical protein [Flavobacterium sp. MK4S-17]